MLTLIFSVCSFCHVFGGSAIAWHSLSYTFFAACSLIVSTSLFMLSVDFCPVYPSVIMNWSPAVYMFSWVGLAILGRSSICPASFLISPRIRFPMSSPNFLLISVISSTSSIAYVSAGFDLYDAYSSDFVNSYKSLFSPLAIA